MTSVHVSTPDYTGTVTISGDNWMIHLDRDQAREVGKTELGRLTIRQILREDATTVATATSDGLAWWDAIAMLAAANRSIDAIYKQEDDDE